MIDIESRKAACKACPLFRHGQVRIETWCGSIDDRPDYNRNCESVRFQRWKARLASPKPSCDRWTAFSSCPCCSVPDPLRGSSAEEHVAAFRDMLSRQFEPPKDLAGDGVVTYGDDRVAPMIVSGIKTLRASGSTFPVQVWQVGQWSQTSTEALAIDPYTRLVDSGEVIKSHPVRDVHVWAMKDYAIAHSGLARALFIDPDAACVADPAPLFEALDGVGFAYWSDFDSMEVHTNHKLMDPLLGGRPWAPCVQGGHYLVDCRRGWRQLMLSRWYNDHADVWWRTNGWSDQEGWRTILSALGDYRCIGPAEWEWVAFVCRYLGTPYIVHRCQGKAWAGSRVPTHTELPMEQYYLDTFYSLWPPAMQPPSEHRARLRRQRQTALARQVA